MHVYLQDSPRLIALVADGGSIDGATNGLDHKSQASSDRATAILISTQSSTSTDPIAATPASSTSTTAQLASAKAVVEVVKGKDLEHLSLQRLSARPIQGCLGLINVGQDLFVAVVTSAQEVGAIRPNEVAMRITAVSFFCVNRATWDESLVSDMSTSQLEPYDSYTPAHDTVPAQPSVYEHPCASLRKLLSTGTFYYAKGGAFDISTRLDQRVADAIRTRTSSAHDISQYDSRFVWNNYMIEPLISFRDRLDSSDRARIDAECFLLLAIQGYVGVYDMATSAAAGPVPTASGAAVPTSQQVYPPSIPPVSSTTSTATATAAPSTSSLASGATAASTIKGTSSSTTIALISRLSWKRAGTRFNTRGIDDDGNVANFVETETIFSNDDVTFSFDQIRGSVPLFWEQQGLQAFNARIQITRSRGASQPAFDRHFADLISHYSKVHALNLLGTRDAETVLSAAYAEHMRHSSAESIAVLPADEEDPTRGPDDGAERIGLTNFDFHTVSRTSGGIDGVRNELRYLGPVQLKRKAFGFTLLDSGDGALLRRQRGVFRTNCLDCLDRTNVIQDMLSRSMLDAFFDAAVGRKLSYEAYTSASHPIWTHHRVLWAENGDALSKIYAGTGALNSSFTRSGKKTLGGLLSDAAKSAGRMYINNFQDKSKQNVIDVLLGNMANQRPVAVFDPVVDSVTAELNSRVDEFSSTRIISIFAGTYNLNGKAPGESLLPWLFPDGEEQEPDIFALGFQEIVQLTPQQILMTDPDKIRIWEAKIMETIAKRPGKRSDYILLRSEQLVGTALIILIKEHLVHDVRLVEAATRKTGLKGMSGNKGGVAIRMDYYDTSICFVTAHFAAGHGAYEERNADYWTIARGLSFARGKSLNSHDHVIWLGDFNYRIDLPNDSVRSMAAQEEFAALYARDQLGRSREIGHVFSGYEEGAITFAPTYKYDNGTTTYDSSEKQRIPAWTDRVLYRGQGLEQQRYARAELRTSDHRPVYAIFVGPVRIIDHLKRDAIRKQLLADKKAANGLGGHHDRRPSATSLSSQSSDGLGVNASDLPEPSSESSRWWHHKVDALGSRNGAVDVTSEDVELETDESDGGNDSDDESDEAEGWTQVNPFGSRTAQYSQNGSPDVDSSGTAERVAEGISHATSTSIGRIPGPLGHKAGTDMATARTGGDGPAAGMGSVAPPTPSVPLRKTASISPTMERRIASGPAVLAAQQKTAPPPIPVKPLGGHTASRTTAGASSQSTVSPAYSAASAPPILPQRPGMGARSASYSSQKSSRSLLDDSD
ncbi:hypothetical protein BCV70DRAFT_198659 [Testicularia cyperi]|uniref:phosphoinositide 5-phosphatase n=1 Tax=Testicularia cyperi TaxID=1882483 RepID=A0A317XWV7_9BASI|nr:hypothetical protein BCV70DRAFT_198659 [Testicularia cyperi]